MIFVVVAAVPGAGNDVVDFQVPNIQFYAAGIALAFLVGVQTRLCVLIRFAPFQVGTHGRTVRWTKSVNRPASSDRRSTTSSAAFSLMSMPIHLRWSHWAATQVVAHPQNGARTVSPGLLDALMIRSSKRFRYRLRGCAAIDTRRSFAGNRVPLTVADC